VFRGNLTLRILLETRTDLVERKISIVARYRANQTCNESDGSTSGIETHPNLVESLYGGNGAEEKSVDGDGDLRRGRTGDDGDDPEIRATAAGDVGAKNV